jgi:arabinogalactan endo-1,4-beta-galactosidase
VNALLFWTHFYSAEQRKEAVRVLQASGIGMVRLHFMWDQIEPVRGSRDWSLVDEVVHEVRAAGIGILGVVSGSAAWAARAPDHATHRDRVITPPLDLSLFTRFVDDLVTRYRDEIGYWEIWNEPNNRDFFHSWGQREPDPGDYVGILRAGFLTAKKVDPTCKVLLGGLAGDGIQSTPTHELTVDYLDKLYRLGAAPYFDILNVHPYPTTGPYEVQIERARAVARRYGDGDKPIWVTEAHFDFKSQGASRPAKVGLLLRRILETDSVERIFWYNLRDQAGLDGIAPLDCGLLDFDMKPKPALETYREVIAEWKRRATGEEPR